MEVGNEGVGDGWFGVGDLWLWGGRVSSTASTKGKTQVPVCSPKLILVGEGC